MAREPATCSFEGSADLDRLVLDASAAAMRGDVLEGLRRALAALGRTRVVGAGPTMVSFDGSVGDVVAGNLYPRAGGVAHVCTVPHRTRLLSFVYAVGVKP